MQIKIGRWKVCIRGYRAQQSISAAVSFRLPENCRSVPVGTERDLVPLNGYTVLTQARTGLKKEWSNESMSTLSQAGLAYYQSLRRALVSPRPCRWFSRWPIHFLRGLNLCFSLWTRPGCSAAQMVRCRFPKLRYG
jgi:hypothetical protein